MGAAELAVRQSIEGAIGFAGGSAAGWWVLHDIEEQAGGRKAQIDVLVGIPGSGLLIIEVKDWPKFEVKPDGAWWYQHWNDSWRRATRSPYVQAEIPQHILLDLLRGRVYAGHLIGSTPRISKSVLFRNISTSELETSWSHEIELERTLGAGFLELAGTELLTVLEDMVARGVEPQRSVDNSAEKLEQIRQNLAPETRVSGLSTQIDRTQKPVS